MRDSQREGEGQSTTEQHRQTDRESRIVAFYRRSRRKREAKGECSDSDRGRDPDTAANVLIHYSPLLLREGRGMAPRLTLIVTVIRSIHRDKMEIFQLLFCGNSFGTLRGPERESLLQTLLIPVFGCSHLIPYCSYKSCDVRVKIKIAKPQADPRSGPL